MAITTDEMRALQPGDTVRIISHKERRRLDNCSFRYDWGSSMDRYCGIELTVKRVETNRERARIYVSENTYYWLPEFIDCVVYSSSQIEAPSEDSLMSLLFS